MWAMAKSRTAKAYITVAPTGAQSESESESENDSYSLLARLKIVTLATPLSRSLMDSPRLWPILFYGPYNITIR